MKEKFILFILAIVAILSFTLSSCSKNDTTGSIITTSSVWKSDADAYAAENAVYPPWQRLSSSYSFLLESASAGTVSFEGADDADGPLVSQFKTDVNNWYPTKIFNYLYVSIGEANRTIEEADSSKAGANLSQSTIDLVRGRAKFIRGLSYLYLTELWGEVPLILSTKATTTERTTRRSIDEVYTQIIKDLTDAESSLPAFDQIRSNPSKGAADAILARAYLQWASKPLSQSEVAAIVNSRTDPAAPTWDTNKLQKASDYADKVINSGNFQLESNFENNFGVPAEDKSVEHIFTIHHDGDGIDAQGNHQTHCTFTWRFDLYQDNHIGPSDVTLLNKFSDNDKRKRFSLTTKLYNQDEPLVANPTKASDYKEYDFVFPVTSPRIGKYIHRNSTFPEVAPGSAAGQPNDINRIEVRYAEVLLTKAEALFRLGKTSEALAPINQIRQRAGLDAYTTLTEDELENEWYLELFFEQKEWLNLTRWRKLITNVLSVKDFEYYKDQYKDAASIAANFGAASSTTNYPFFAKIYKHLHAKYDNVSGKFYRFPIPKGLSGEDLGIQQNPGY